MARTARRVSQQEEWPHLSYTEDVARDWMSEILGIDSKLRIARLSA